MSLLLLLTGYPQGGQGIPPEPEPEPEPEPTPTPTSSIGGGGPRGFLYRRKDRAVPQWENEEEELFLIL